MPWAQHALIARHLATRQPNRRADRTKRPDVPTAETLGDKMSQKGSNMTTTTKDLTGAGKQVHARSANNWSDPAFPKSGWVIEDVADLKLETDSGIGVCDHYKNCEMCGHEHIRYAAALFHPEKGLELLAGRRCTGRLTGIPDDVESLFRAMRLRGQRYDRFKKKAWQSLPEGIELSLRDATISVRPRRGMWDVICTPKAKDKVERLGGADTLEEAKKVAFDLYEVMKGRW